MPSEYRSGCPGADEDDIEEVTGATFDKSKSTGGANDVTRVKPNVPVSILCKSDRRGVLGVDLILGG